MIRQSRHIEFSDLPGDKTDLPGDKTGLPYGKAVAGEYVHEPPPHPVNEETGHPGAEDRTEHDAPRFRIKELLDGTILVRENMIRQLPYVLFLTVLGVIYIGNRFHAEHMVRQISELKTDVGNLRAEQITITSELMNISRPSEVAALVKMKNLGLKESMEPPKKLRRR